MFIHLDFCYVLFVLLFCSKIVLFLCHPVVGTSSCILPLIADRICFVVLNMLFRLYRFTLYRYPFSLPSFASTFWFISSSFIVLFTCVNFSFLFQHVPAFFFSVLSFLFAVIDFLSVFQVELSIRKFPFFFFGGSTIFSPAEINLFNSVMMLCCMLIYMFMQDIYIYILDTYRRNDKDRRGKTSLTKYLPLTLLQGFEKGYSRFACERELETEQKL